MRSYYRDPTAPAPTAPRSVGVTAVVERDGCFLVERRTDDPGRWAFAGGTMEAEESALETLAPELREETQFTIEDASLLAVFTDPMRIVAHPDGTVRRVVSLAFRVVPVDRTEPVPSQETVGMQWVGEADLRDLDFWPSHLPIRAALLSHTDGVVVE
jgi:8-oxo-dGTP pyrophosphatase MutT (NUDIX family)